MYDGKIHGMHIYVNFNLSGKCNKSDFAASQRGGEGWEGGGEDIPAEKTRGYHVP